MSTDFTRNVEPPVMMSASGPRKSITMSVSSGAGRKSISSRQASGFERRRTTMIDLWTSSSRKKRPTAEVISSVFHMGILVIALFLGVACMIMGAAYWTKCPGNVMLPVILLFKGPLIGTELGAGFILLARNYEWARKLVRGECMNKIHTATGFLFILSGLWFSIMAFWTFEKSISYNPSDKNYCHPHFHKFAFGIVLTIFLLLGLLILLFSCGCLILAALLLINTRLRGADNPEVRRNKRHSTVHYGENSFFLPENK